MAMATAMVVFFFFLGSLSNDDGLRQRERHKTMALMSKNNRSARAFYILVHFFAVLYKTTTWNNQILGFLENVSAWRQVFVSFSLL